MAYSNRVGEVYVVRTPSTGSQLANLSPIGFDFRTAMHASDFDIVDGVDGEGRRRYSQTPRTPPILPVRQRCNSVKRAKPKAPDRAAPLPHLSSDLDVFSGLHLQ